MRKRLIAALAVVMSLLIITTPVAADHSITLSSHTTASDLSGGTLSNAEVERSGSAGYVGHDTYSSSAVARWAFDEGSGSTAYDHVGNNDGTISGATWTSGVSGQAMDFDGTDDRVSMGDPSLVEGTNSLTISGRVRLQDNSSTNIIAGKELVYRISIDSEGRAEFLTGNNWGGAIAKSNESLSTGQWYHILGTYDGSTKRLYINGELVDTVATTGSIGTNSREFGVGAIQDSSGGWLAFMDGRIDDVRVYSKALSPGEVARVEGFANTKLSATATERWALDAGQGSTAFGDAGSDGTLNGNPQWVVGKSGQALYFDGSGDDVNSSVSGLPSDEMAYAFWMNLEDVTNYDHPIKIGGGATTFVKNQTGNNPPFVRSSWDINGTNYQFGAKNFSTGSWVHVTVTYDGKRIRQYVNGTVVADTAASGPIDYSSQYVAIGSARGGNYVNGTIDEVRIYPQNLTKTEVSSLYQSQTAQLPETSTYTSADHSATNTVSGWTDLTLQNASATVTWQGYDGSSWTTLNSSTFSTSGNHTLTWTEFAGDKVRVQVDYSTSHPDHLARLHGEGVIGQTHAPVVDNSSATPDSSTKTIDSTPATLKINMSDVDFQNSDSLTVAWFVDGSKRKETTQTANGTASVELDNLDAGSHTWSVEVTDQQGHTTNSETFIIAVPGEIRVFNEENPSTLVNNTTLRVRFFEDGSEKVIQRQVSDGTVNMTGVSATSELIVTIKDDGTRFQYRRIVLSALVDQQDIYLLPDNASSAAINFQLQDSTGRFPSSESTLFIERALTKDFDGDGQNETKYRTIAGDNFGAAEDFPVTLATNERYRLRVTNGDGETRVLGAYTPTADVTEIIPIGRVSFKADTETEGVFDAQLITQDDGQRVIRLTYIDTAVKTDDITVQIVREDGSNTLQPNVTTTGPFGIYQATHEVPASAPDDVSYEVTWSVTRDGKTLGDSTIVGDVPAIAKELGIDPGVLAMISYIAIIAVLGLTAIKSPSYAGIPTVVVAGGLTAIGAVGIPPLFLGGAGLISILFAAGGGR